MHKHCRGNAADLTLILVSVNLATLLLSNETRVIDSILSDALQNNTLPSVSVRTSCARSLTMRRGHLVFFLSGCLLISECAGGPRGSDFMFVSIRGTLFFFVV